MRSSHTQRLLKSLTIAMLTGSLFLTGMSASQGAVKGLFVGNEFYAPSASWQNTARSSGYTSLFLFTMHVQSNGNLDYNGTPIVTNGVYVGDSTWGAKLAACKAAPSTVNRIELTIGGWGDPSFTNIKNLIVSQGTGSSSILYRSFQALKNATGIDAIQYDDEQTYDVGSAVSFGNLISTLGMKVTFCPYTNQAFWVNAKSQLGSKVDAIYLQCYDGGAGNDPGNWNSAFGGFKVTPGLWGNVDTMASSTAKFRGWQTNLGINGGFLWLNGGFPAGDGARWAEALRLGVDPVPFFNIVNQNSGKCLDLIGGNTANGANVNQWGYDGSTGNQRWALAPTENGDHFKLISWVSGKAMAIAGDSLTNGAQLVDTDYTYGDPSQQWDLVDVGSGWYNIKNVRSGLLMDVDGASTADNAKVQQYGNTNTAAQRWRLQPWGNYYLRAENSGKYVGVTGAGNGAAVVQNPFVAQPWLQWAFNPRVDGWFSVQSLYTPGRAVSPNASSTPGQALWIWDYSSSNPADQLVRIRPRTNGTFSYYFASNNLAWDIRGASQADATPVQQYTNNESSAQQFRMERVQ
ncbi:MAG: RICIN domain-containing protein [Capsulimonas sp.]|uniref:RICIN domain-containing protein n=1 Tax=Capsulimonas sp. TaxID=2494211 RepID=UPI00326548F3